LPELQPERAKLKEAVVHKSWVRIAIVVAAVIVVVFGLVPLFVPVDAFRPGIENQLSESLGRTVSLGHLGLSFWRGSLMAHEIAVADDPSFGSSPFVQAQSLRVGVKFFPLLFRRKVEITKLVLDSPSINLIHAQDGRWNFSSLGGATTPTAPAAAHGNTAIPDLSVGELEIRNGTATVSSLPAAHTPFVYSAIALSVERLSLLSSFPFKLSAKLPASGSLHLSGTAGPVARNNAADTPFHATVQLEQFDPVAAGLVDAKQGIAMLLGINAQATSDGTTLSSSGTIEAAHLRLSRTGSAAPQPIHSDYSITEQLATRTGQVSNIAVHTGSVSANLTGSYQMTPQGVDLNLHLAAPHLPIDQLEQLLPAFGVTLPSGSRLRGGTLTANLAITGPSTAFNISGPVEIDNTTLAGFDLGTKIAGLHPVGPSGGTEIQTLRADLNSSPATTQISNIYGNVPRIGTATGSGTVTPAGALDFKMVATFSSSNVVGAAATQAVNAVGSYIGGFLPSKNKPAAPTNRGIPLIITGTTASPSIRANFASMLK
jgi:AsmA protein